MNLVSKVKRNYLALGVILLLGLFLRLYHPLALFQYSHDQDLLSWFVKDIVVNHNLRLIGQETSVHGVFIGPLFYYLAVPFYVLWGLSPVGGIALATLFGLFTVFSVYFVFKAIWNERIGLIGSFMYSVSFYTVMTDREVVPTTPVIVWSVWFLYALHEISKGNQKRGFVVTGILIGLIWHLNVALALLLPLLVVSQLYSQKKIQLSNLIIPLISIVVFISPFLVFEMRHNFSEIKSVLTQFNAPPAFPQTKLEKLDRVIQLFEKNLGSVWATTLFGFPRRPVLYLLPVITIFLLYTKKLTKKITSLLVLWIFLFLIFFTFNSLNLSEYYLNGTVVVFIAVASLFINYLLSRKAFFFLGIILTVLYFMINVKSFLDIPINKSGFIERSQIISEIKRDAQMRGYPCVSLSYITSPGSNLGYRYLIYTQKLKTKPVSSLAPVYSIVFPHSLVNGIDKPFGALGLIYPDYKKYKLEEVKKICEGEDYNLTEPLFGYVQ